MLQDTARKNYQLKRKSPRTFQYDRSGIISVRDWILLQDSACANRNRPGVAARIIQSQRSRLATARRLRKNPLVGYANKPDS